MQNINQFISANISTFVLILLGLFFVSIIYLIIIAQKLKKSSKRYNALMRGMNDKNLEEVLFQHMRNVESVSNRVNELEIEYKKLAKVAQNSIQKVGMVRFNAFEDTGSDLSFAVALLDAHKDGVIISSIFSRHESRIYAKPVKDGISVYNLSNEEQEALDEALKKS